MTKNCTDKYKTIFFLSCFLLSLQLIVAATLRAEEISAETVLDRMEAVVGEPLSMQVRVDGADTADPPDLKGLDDFTIQERGGQGNSSTSVTNINGNWQRITRHTYSFNYTITPKHAGELTIPPFSVTVDGKTYRTAPVTITVSQPQETDDLKLRIFLSASKCYVGEPITMIVTWFIGKDVNGFEFHLPVITDPRFTLIPLAPDHNTPGQEELKIPVGTDTITAVKGRGELAGRNFLTVTFQYQLLAREAGNFSLPEATVVCQTVSGFRRAPRNSPFHGFSAFDDFFGDSGQPVYRTMVVPSNTPELAVLPLPEQGRPADFSGLVGNYTIRAEANPLEVNIGDPLTLTVTVSGPCASQAKFPDLTHFFPASSFKIPEEIASGDMAGNNKVFTQTIRVKDTSVTTLPAVELNYFDPIKKNYQIASSDPLPITVHEARVVTATDAQGKPVETRQNELKTIDKGLAANYDGNDTLINQQSISFQNPLIILILAAPPLVFFLICCIQYFQKRRRDTSELLKTKHALNKLEKRLGGTPLSPQVLADALRQYLAVKLHKKAGTLTFIDLEPVLQEQQIDQELLLELKALLNTFETWQYSGQSIEVKDVEQIRSRTLLAARRLDALLQ